MATGSAFVEAADMILKLPRLSIGCHVTLVDGMAVLPAPRIASLTNPSGRFESKLSRFILRAFSQKLRAEEIEAEATAQIRKLQAAGIRLSHFDTHQHTHMFPQVAGPLLRAAQACGVRAVRNPFESPRLSFSSWNRQFWVRQLQTALLSSLSAGFRRSVAEHGLVTTDGTIGVAATGSITMRSLEPLIEHLPEGTWELVCHPGYNDADLKKAGTRLLASREVELKVLTAPALRETLESAGIELITFRDLAT